MQDHIPENHEGAKSDTENHVTFDNENAAKQHFEVVKRRFLDVSRWEEIGGVGAAKFSLFDRGGAAKTGKPEVGDYFKIEAPAPDNESGEGADWVQLELVEVKDDEATIRVHPATNPQNADDTTAHFFEEEATSTFIVRREGLKVFAEVHGRNEKPNNEDVSLKDKVRNTLVAIGAMLGFSKLQWSGLTKGLVAVDEKD